MGVRKLKHDACLAVSTYLGSSGWQLGLELFRDAQQRGTGRQGRAGHSDHWRSDVAAICRAQYLKQSCVSPYVPANIAFSATCSVNHTRQ
jgi:hypothetical protein